MISFSEQVAEYIEGYKRDMRELIIRVAIRCTTKLIERSPVSNPLLWKNPYFKEGYDGGYFRGNWQVTFDSPATAPVDRIDKVGLNTLSINTSIINTFTLDRDRICITNCSPYAEYLEMGHSSQAPYGLVGLLALEFQFIVKEEMARVG